MSAIYIPDELIVQILKRLPAKSLLRLMSVSKSWYSLIKNPSFISDHFNHQINKEPKYLLYRNWDYDYFVYSNDENFDMHLQFNDRYYEPVLKCTLVACCNGIICFMKPTVYEVNDISFVLWNSSLRKSFDLKVPNCPRDNDENNACWFGFDEASNDYKLVWVGYSRHAFTEIRSSDVYMYSFNEGAWRCINSSFSFNNGYLTLRGVYLNGVIHWVFYEYYDHQPKPVVTLTFSLEDKTFGVCNLPSEIVDEEPSHSREVTLMTMKRGGKNCLVALHDDWTKLDPWVMEEEGEEESWVKDFSIDSGRTMILDARMNGETVMDGESGGLVSFDHRHTRMKPLSFRYLRYVGTYMESLVLLL